MSINSFADSNKEPDSQRQEMSLHQQRTCQKRKLVGHQHFDWVRVLCCHANGGVKSMVNFVDASEKHRMMKKAMRPVE